MRGRQGKWGMWSRWSKQKLVEATSDLIYLLVLAEKEQQREAPGGRWERYYADFFLRRYRK